MQVLTLPEICDLEIAGENLQSLFMFGDCGGLDNIWGTTYCYREYLRNRYDLGFDKSFFAEEFDENCSLVDMLTTCYMPGIALIRTDNRWHSSKCTLNGQFVDEILNIPRFIEFDVINELKKETEIMLISKYKSFFCLSSKLNNIEQKNNRTY